MYRIHNGRNGRWSGLHEESEERRWYIPSLRHSIIYLQLLGRECTVYYTETIWLRISVASRKLQLGGEIVVYEGMLGTDKMNISRTSFRKWDKINSCILRASLRDRECARENFIQIPNLFLDVYNIKLQV